MQLANRLVVGSYLLIGAVAQSVVLVAASIIRFQPAPTADPSVFVDKGLGLLNNLVSAIFPLIAAWIGAVIAYYFARENFEAATKSANDLLMGMQRDRLARIPASEAMVPRVKLTVATTPKENGEALNGSIFKRFQDRNLGRMIIVDDDNRGKGSCTTARC